MASLLLAAQPAAQGSNLVARTDEEKLQEQELKLKLLGTMDANYHVLRLEGAPGGFQTGLDHKNYLDRFHKEELCQGKASRAKKCKKTKLDKVTHDERECVVFGCPFNLHAAARKGKDGASVMWVRTYVMHTCHKSQVLNLTGGATTLVPARYREVFLRMALGDNYGNLGSSEASKQVKTKTGVDFGPRVLNDYFKKHPGAPGSADTLQAFADVLKQHFVDLGSGFCEVKWTNGSDGQREFESFTLVFGSTVFFQFGLLPAIAADVTHFKGEAPAPDPTHSQHQARGGGSAEC